MPRHRPARCCDPGELSIGTEGVTLRLPGESSLRAARILYRQVDPSGRCVHLVLDRHVHDRHVQIDGWITAGAVTTELLQPEHAPGFPARP